MVDKEKKWENNPVTVRSSSVMSLVVVVVSGFERNGEGGRRDKRFN